MVFLGQHLAALLLELPLKSRKPPLDSPPFYQLIEGEGPLPDRHMLPSLDLRKGEQIIGKALAQSIDLLQLLLREPPVNAHKPVFPFLPAAYPQSQHIVFQEIRLLRFHAGQAASQVPEHRLIGKILIRNLQKGPDKFHKGILQDASLIVQEAGDPVLWKHPLQNRAVGLHVARDQGEIPVMVPLFPHQLPDLRGRPGRLGLGVFQHVEADFLLASRVGLLAQPEEVLLQAGQGAPCPETALLRRVNPQGRLGLHLGLRRQAHQPRHRLFAQIEKLMLSRRPVRILPLVHRHRHDHLLRVQHQLLHQLILNRRKAGKPIQHDHAFPDFLRALHRLAEHLQKLLRRDILILEVGVEGAVQHLHVAELIIQAGPVPVRFQEPAQILLGNRVLGKL